MVSKLVEHLKKKTAIDLLFFSGDLVNSGSKYEDFEAAHRSLILKLCEELHIPLINVATSPGNHDIQREKTVKAIINYFDEKITSSDALYQEYQKKTDEYTLSLKPSINYLKYIESFFSENYEEVDELCKISKKTIDGKEIAIVSINSAWLSNGLRDDINLLMFPAVVLKNAITKIKGADCKILIIHHPLNYFKEFNYVELEDLIHKEFDLMFSGHLHREHICANYAGYNGIYSNCTQATLTFDKNGEIGYSIINYDLEKSGEIIIERAHYLKKEHTFIDIESVHIQIPVGAEKAQQNKLRNKITSKFLVELNNANELLLEYDEEKSKNFVELFTSPLLSLSSGSEITNENQSTLDFESLYSDSRNFLIFGKDKSGKTTILKRIQLYFLKHYSSLGKVPFYLDYKELEAKGKEININKQFKVYYEISNQESERIISSGNVILLIDNLNFSSEVNNSIVEFLESHKNIQFFICSEYIASRAHFDQIDHLEYVKLYFKDLTRKEIRLYSEKNYSVKEYNKEEVLERISKMLKQLQLPVNYWTVSLILLIYKKSQNDYNKNLFAILDLCVDEILQKKQLSLVKANLTFDQYKAICSQLAFHLLTKHKDSVYSASSTEIISFIDSKIKENERIVGDAKDIFDYLFDVGLLKEKNSHYTFRLNGIFEYFLAYYIHQHPNIKEEILNNDGIYLSFKNELEIYSGLNRKDEDFLHKVFNKTKLVFDNLIDEYREYGTIDNVLMLKLGQVHEFVETVKRLQVSSPLSHEVQDLAKDAVDPLGTNSEVHLKEPIDSAKKTHEVLERYLEILARVLKNSDGITNTSLVHEIFDYLVEAYIVFGFYLIDEYAKLPRSDNDFEVSESESGELRIGKDILRMLSSFIPMLSQTLLYDGVGHPNMAIIIEKHIEKYKADFRNNQYKLFLLYFLMMDIDIKTSRKIVPDVFKNIKLSPLKVSSYFKLNFYLAFKAHKNKDLELFLTQKIREAKINIDSKSLESKSLEIDFGKKDEDGFLKPPSNL
jgi:predicted MPP superfamily phosphohydrolase